MCHDYIFFSGFSRHNKATTLMTEITVHQNVYYLLYQYVSNNMPVILTFDIFLLKEYFDSLRSLVESQLRRSITLSYLFFWQNETYVSILLYCVVFILLQITWNFLKNHSFPHRWGTMLQLMEFQHQNSSIGLICITHILLKTM